MDEVPADHCGYTWPEDYEIEDDPYHQGCCFREVLSDTDRCAWHTDPDDTDEKTVQTLRDARVSVEAREEASLYGELLDGVILRGLVLGDELSLNRVVLRGADLTDAILREADLTDANLERATLVRTNLFDTTLTGVLLHGATLTDVQITADTTICTENVRSRITTGLQQLNPPPFCGYDIERRQADDLNADERQELLAKAASAYQEFEELARENAQPALQSSMFVLRQDIQRARYWERGEYLQHAFARVSRSVFKHGESVFRISLWVFLTIVGYAAVYRHFDLVLDLDGGGFIQSPVDVMYFSTLTFTTLGLGDFQPDPASELARALVTT